MIGKTWSIAQLSGSDWKSEKLQKYRSTSVVSRSAMMSAKSRGLSRKPTCASTFAVAK